MNNDTPIRAHVVKYGASGGAPLVGVYLFKRLPRVGEFVGLKDAGGSSRVLRVASLHHDAVEDGQQLPEDTIMLLCEEKDDGAQNP